MRERRNREIVEQWGRGRVKVKEWVERVQQSRAVAETV